jgi:methyl coenzyme M reductase subunit D
VRTFKCTQGIPESDAKVRTSIENFLEKTCVECFPCLLEVNSNFKKYRKGVFDYMYLTNQLPEMVANQFLGIYELTKEGDE